jgi:hypothetical protein
MTFLNSEKCMHVEKTILYLNIMLDYDFYLFWSLKIGFYTKSVFGI